MLGAQQIDSIVKSRYAKKVNRKPASFATVLEQERDETPTPVETVVSANSTDTSGFQILSMTKHRPKPEKLVVPRENFWIPRPMSLFPVHPNCSPSPSIVPRPP